MAKKAPVKPPLKLMLLANVQGLGSLGDVVRVRPGFARNYLLPRGLATRQSADTVRRVESLRKKAAAVEQKKVDDAKAAIAQLANISIHVESKAGEGGQLYGSVTAPMIAEQLQKQGVAIDTTGVLLDAPIKQLGIYDVKVRLHGELEGSVKLYVVATPPEKPAKAEKPAETSKPAKAAKAKK